ncbi:PDZ domain-containing protein [Chryseobacterium sp. SC28]|uniref:PDZ domain-containing protein n=1 Tax=Chryseobacterium sp. SC28 TaxID=2268028 RepID=UPI000F64CB51|nr:PDZ domain-containing protein [Chryseobacterium sp. SC28]RRQ46348.1 PDZ domain-containing protein [Chryseobacterium sp. SC28]
MKIWIIIGLIFGVLMKAQDGFVLENAEKTVIKFKLINNMIFVPVTVNEVELTFLLDSGIAETLLFSLENKTVDFKNTEKITFKGLGETVSIEALKSIKNNVVIGKNFVDKSHTIFLVLDEDFNISQDIGIPVNGIIGYYFFKNHPVEINYIKKTITVYKDQSQFPKKIKRFSGFPMSVEYSKPYMMADVELKHEKESSKLLLDLGNTDSVWLFPALIKNFIYNRPNIDDFLGRGFSGDIFGKRSRINSLSIGNFRFNKPVASMPDEYSIQHLKLVNDRKGSIGSEILRRFTVIFDYPDRKIYFNANKDVNDPFLIDGSGLEIKQDGLLWEKEEVRVKTAKLNPSSNAINVLDNGAESFQYKFTLKPLFLVSGTRKDSPAQKAGILKNDKLIAIDGKQTKEMSLNKIQQILKTNVNRNINIEINRNGILLKFQLTLSDPIPYIEED